MIYPRDRFAFSSSRRARKKHRAAVPILFLVLTIGCIVTAVIFTRGREDSGESVRIEPQGTKSLVELWNAHDYDGVMLAAQSRLAVSPMDSQALAYLGFSAFYKGAAQITLEDKLPLLDLAVTTLRKANLIETRPFPAEISYVLGKAYYQKGKYFSDVSVQYLEESIENGYRGEDSYEYLGLAYAQLGNYEKSVENFLHAAEGKPSDLLYMTLAQSYLQLRRLDEAEQSLERAIGLTQDSTLELKSRFLLAEIFTSRNAYDRAIREYERILEIDAQSADAHFSLGEIYQKTGDTLKARAEWRAALRIDGTHYGARLRLY